MKLKKLLFDITHPRKTCLRIRGDFAAINLVNVDQQIEALTGGGYIPEGMSTEEYEETLRELYEKFDYFLNRMTEDQQKAYLGDELFALRQDRQPDTLA